jgi:hypothetical protein
MRLEIRTQRDRTTQEITTAWKQGFARLRAENDRMQQQAAAEYQQRMKDVDVWLNQQLAAGPPQ